MKSIDFWFSIGSTYTYLSVTRVDSISKSENVIFNWIPFSVRKIMMEMDNIPFTPPSKKIKSDYMWRDIERRAQFYGLSPKLPAPYPLTQFDLANKIAILGMNEGWGINYVKNTYQRWFEERKEPATEPNLSEIMEDMNLNKDEVLKKVNSPEIEAIYQKNTSNAFQSGVFGSPTFIHEGEVFWGDDRLEDCIKWLNLKQTTEI